MNQTFPLKFNHNLIKCSYYTRVQLYNFVPNNSSKFKRMFKKKFFKKIYFGRGVNKYCNFNKIFMSE